MRKVIPFLLVLALFTSCASTIKQSDCKQFKTGRFQLHSELDNTITIIERNDSVQTETNSTGDVVKARVKWIGDCEYELTYLTQTPGSTDSIIHFVQSRPMKTTIIQTGKDYYIFRSTMEGTSVILIDTLRVVK